MTGDPYDWARGVCASLPGSQLDRPFGDDTDVFKVGGKMFALLSRDREPVWLSLKLPPESNLELRARFPDSVLPGYHLSKQHWSTFVLDAVMSREDLGEHVRTSYDLVVASLPKRLRP